MRHRLHKGRSSVRGCRGSEARRDGSSAPARAFRRLQGRPLQALSDVLTYHVYSEPAILEKSVAEGRQFSKESGKQIFITETMANFAFMPFDVEKVASDDAQLKHYQKVVPTLLKSQIGWMSWGLVVGRIFNPYCDIFYANGYPRPAAIYLESVLKPTTSSL